MVTTSTLKSTTYPLNISKRKTPAIYVDILKELSFLVLFLVPYITSYLSAIRAAMALSISLFLTKI